MDENAIAKALHDHGLCVEVDDGHRAEPPACVRFARAVVAAQRVSEDTDG